MIVVNAVIESTEADIQTMKSAIATMEAASQAEEGCEDYTFSVELNNACKLRITERWLSLEALQAHLKTAHMATFQTAMGEHPPINVDVTFYEAQKIDSPFG